MALDGPGEGASRCRRQAQRSGRCSTWEATGRVRLGSGWRLGRLVREPGASAAGKSLTGGPREKYYFLNFDKLGFWFLAQEK
jgi:hypothetical protein